jgi:hypothetical protein
MPTGSLIKRQGEARLYVVKGFTLNYKAKHLVNFDAIKNMIMNPKDNDTVTVNRKKIKRKRNRCGNWSCIQIVANPEDKKYRVCFTK